MLHRLSIRNLILVDQCDIFFHTGFNVITGETGSGKSVLISAILLLMGERADTDLIRYGEDKAVIEAEFTTPSVFCEQFRTLCEEYSIEDLFEQHSITIRREIFVSGKSKAFINDHIVPAIILKKLGCNLIEFSSQHAHMVMKDEEYGLHIVDNVNSEIRALQHDFSQLYEQEKILRRKVATIENELLCRDEEVSQLSSDIQQIHDSHVEEIDADDLFQQYLLLEQRQKIYTTLSTFSELIDGSSTSGSGHAGKASILSLLLSLKNNIERSSEADALIETIKTHVHTAYAEMQESSFLIKKRLCTFDIQECEKDRIEEQLTKIEKVEKRWGKDRSQIKLIAATMRARVTELQNKETELDILKEEHLCLLSSLEKLCEAMHSIRLNNAHMLQQKIEDELKDLNMAACQLDINVTKGLRRESGESYVTIYITPNTGEKKVTIMSGASGGEMARVYLAIQTVVSSLQKIPTIIFDEVDANIGGVTAIHVGKKLQTIGVHRQVIAITHFPQVTDMAAKHFSIQKKEENGRTYTLVRALENKKEKELEKRRMIGSPHI